MAKGIVISDFHIGMAGSNGERYLKTIKEKISSGAYNMLVLNGDMVEAKDILLPEDKKAAIIDNNFVPFEDLVKLAVEKKCRVIIGAGNHELHPHLLEKFEQLEKEHPEYVKYFDSFHNRQHLQENTAFLHGHAHFEVGANNDIQHLMQAFTGKLEIRAGHNNPIQTYLVGQGKGDAMHELVSVLSPRLIARKVFPMKKIAPAILEHLENTLSSEEFNKLDTVCMGHIHYPSYKPEKVQYKGKDYTFHVTGPAIKFNKNTMLEFDIDDNTGRISNFHQFGRDGKVAIKSR